jgi:hypothetical protein
VAERIPRREVLAQGVGRRLAERDDALAAPLSRDPQKAGGEIHVGEVETRGLRDAQPGGVEQLEQRPLALRNEASSSSAESNRSVSGSDIARGSVFGTRGEGRPRAGFLSRWPSRQAHRKKDRRVDRWRASERLASLSRWRCARYDRTASVSTFESGVFAAGALANSSSQNAANRSRSRR